MSAERARMDVGRDGERVAAITQAHSAWMAGRPSATSVTHCGVWRPADIRAVKGDEAAYAETRYTSGEHGGNVEGLEPAIHR
jgi:hypothetical protein